MNKRSDKASFFKANRYQDADKTLVTRPNQIKTSFETCFLLLTIKEMTRQILLHGVFLYLKVFLTQSLMQLFRLKDKH